MSIGPWFNIFNCIIHGVLSCWKSPSLRSTIFFLWFLIWLILEIEEMRNFLLFTYIILVSTQIIFTHTHIVLALEYLLVWISLIFLTILREEVSFWWFMPIKVFLGALILSSVLPKWRWVCHIIVIRLIQSSLASHLCHIGLVLIQISLR